MVQCRGLVRVRYARSSERSQHSLCPTCVIDLTSSFVKTLVVDLVVIGIHDLLRLRRAPNQPTERSQQFTTDRDQF